MSISPDFQNHSSGDHVDEPFLIGLNKPSLEQQELSEYGLNESERLNRSMLKQLQTVIKYGAWFHDVCRITLDAYNIEAQQTRDDRVITSDENVEFSAKQKVSSALNREARQMLSAAFGRNVMSKNIVVQAVEDEQAPKEKLIFEVGRPYVRNGLSCLTIIFEDSRLSGVAFSENIQGNVAAPELSRMSGYRVDAHADLTRNLYVVMASRASYAQVVALTNERMAKLTMDDGSSLEAHQTDNRYSGLLFDNRSKEQFFNNSRYACRYDAGDGNGELDFVELYTPFNRRVNHDELRKKVSRAVVGVMPQKYVADLYSLMHIQPLSNTAGDKYIRTAEAMRAPKKVLEHARNRQGESS